MLSTSCRWCCQSLPASLPQTRCLSLRASQAMAGQNNLKAQACHGKPSRQLRSLTSACHGDDFSHGASHSHDHSHHGHESDSSHSQHSSGDHHSRAHHGSHRSSHDHSNSNQNQDDFDITNMFDTGDGEAVQYQPSSDQYFKQQGRPANPDFWAHKPVWCQPWSILLSGTAFIAGARWISGGSDIATGVAAVPILAWWYLFLVLVPGDFRKYAEDN